MCFLLLLQTLCLSRSLPLSGTNGTSLLLRPVTASFYISLPYPSSSSAWILAGPSTPLLFPKLMRTAGGSHKLCLYTALHFGLNRANSPGLKIPVFVNRILLFTTMALQELAELHMNLCYSLHLISVDVLISLYCENSAQVGLLKLPFLNSESSASFLFVSLS